MDEKQPGVYILPKLFSDRMLPMLVTFYGSCLNSGTSRDGSSAFDDEL